MIDWGRIFVGAKWFYITGITAALSASSAEGRLGSTAGREAGWVIDLS